VAGPREDTRRRAAEEVAVTAAPATALYEPAVYVVYVRAPCGFEPETLGEARCRAVERGGWCRYVCTSRRPFYVRLSPDLPFMFSRPAPLGAYLALLLSC